jgi:hypothetical protein
VFALNYYITVQSGFLPSSIILTFEYHLYMSLILMTIFLPIKREPCMLQCIATGCREKREREGIVIMAGDHHGEEVRNKQVLARDYIYGNPKEEDMYLSTGTILLKVPEGSNAVLVKNL